MTSHDAQGLAAPVEERAARTVQAQAPAPAMALATACPRCGAAVPSEGSDFCEQCSAHLYPGHCVFCLEPFSSGQQHCRRCGLPPEGVVCGACGTFSRFDFCPNPDCGAGLTPRAAAELARVDSDPEIQDAFVELDEIDAVIAAVEANVPPPSPAEPTAVAAPPATRPSLAALRAAAMGAKSATEKARVRQLAEQAAQDALHAVSSRPFPTAQEARAAGTALQVALRCRVQVERLETIAWRCNRFGVEHPEPGGMSLCSDPASGGVPVMRVITEIADGSVEFTA